MKKALIRVMVVLTFLLVCMHTLYACGGNDQDLSKITGQWQVQGSQVSVVFTDSQYKAVGITYTYKLDPSTSTITYLDGDTEIGTAQYSFSEDGQTMTLVDNGGEDGSERTTVFEKLSDDIDATPSADAYSEKSSDNG